MMSATTTRVLSWSGVRGVLVAAAVFLMGSPAGFSICGLSWRFPWLADNGAPSVPTRPADTSWENAPWDTTSRATRQPTQVTAEKPLPPPTSPTVQCIATSPMSVIFCVTVKNDRARSLRIRSGHLNLSEVGIANADWPTVSLPPWQPARLQLARVQITADRELPGALHNFPLDLTIPPGHQRRFLLQVDVAQLATWQRSRFFAVGSLVLDEGTEELSTPDFNLFGRRLMADNSDATEDPKIASGELPSSAPAPISILPEPPIAAPIPGKTAPWPQPVPSVQKTLRQIENLATSAADLRHELSLPSMSRHFQSPPSDPALDATPPPPKTWWWSR